MVHTEFNREKQRIIIDCRIRFELLDYISVLYHFCVGNEEFIAKRQLKELDIIQKGLELRGCEGGIIDGFLFHILHQEGVIFSTMIDLDYKGGGAKGLVEDLVIQ